MRGCDSGRSGNQLPSAALCAAVGHIQRRTFLATLLAGVLPMPGIGQSARIRKIGFLSGRWRPASIYDDVHGEFLRGMADLGYVEGRDFIMEWRFAEGDYSRFPRFALELVEGDVDVIVVAFTVAALAAQRATSKIPIVLGYSVDPVAAGLVKSLARPGGNTTGLAAYLPEISSKSIELLAEVTPGLSSVAVFINPANVGTQSMWLSASEAAVKQGIKLLRADAGSITEVGAWFNRFHSEGVGALLVLPDPLFNPPQTKVAELAIQYRLPSVHPYPEYTKVGGLMSYGDSVGRFWRRSAYFVDKIWKGALPADLPVEQPTDFVLSVNLRTAKALGVKIPVHLLTRADEVIE